MHVLPSHRPQLTHLAVGAGVDDVLDLAVHEVVEGVDVLPHQPAQLQKVRQQLPLLLHLLHGRRQVVVVRERPRLLLLLLLRRPAVPTPCLKRLRRRPRHATLGTHTPGVDTNGWDSYLSISRPLVVR